MKGRKRRKKRKRRKEARKEGQTDQKKEIKNYARYPYGNIFFCLFLIIKIKALEVEFLGK